MIRQLGPREWLIDFYLSGRSSRRVRRKMTGTEREAEREEVKIRTILELEEKRAKRPKSRRANDFQWLTTAEYTSIIGQCRNDLQRASLDVLLLTGLRVSDFVALDESMVRAGTLAVPVIKTRRMLYQRCPEELAGLVRLVAGRWTYSKARRFVRAVTKRAGLRESGPHILRHTCASWQVQADIPIYRVRDWMGHASLQATQRYAHLSATVEWDDAFCKIPARTQELINRVWLRRKAISAKYSLSVLDRQRKSG